MQQSSVTPAQLWVVTIGGLLVATLASHYLHAPSGGLSLADTVVLLRQLFGTFSLSAGVLLLSIAALYLFKPAAQPVASQRVRPQAAPAAAPFTAAGATPVRPQAQPRSVPVYPAIPQETPLARNAAVLLEKAHSVPNFSTTPLAGQHRVLQKLAENFVPVAQRSAALSLALFRLRQPRAA